MDAGAYFIPNQMNFSNPRPAAVIAKDGDGPPDTDAGDVRAHGRRSTGWAVPDVHVWSCWAATVTALAVARDASGSASSLVLVDQQRGIACHTRLARCVVLERAATTWRFRGHWPGPLGGDA